MRPSRVLWLAVYVAIVFLGSASLAVLSTGVLGYWGAVPVVVLYGLLAMAPLALVCWVLTATKAGDWWTLAYVSVWVAGIFVATVRDFVVSVL